MSHLPPPIEISQVSLGSPSQADLAEALPNSNPDGIFVTVASAAVQGLSSQRAEWQAQIVIAAIWKSFATEGLPVVAGGRLVDPEANFADVQSTETWFTELEDSGRYLNSFGQASKLQVGESEVRAAVEQSAAKTGATVSNFAFGTSLGDVTEVGLTVQDPASWIASMGEGSPWGSLDIRDLDGAMLIIRDGNGDLIKAMTFSAGYQAGSAVYGPLYNKPPYALNADSATIPASSTSTSH